MGDYDTVILDIEGTITPITFVKNTLFPFVTNGLDAFLDRTWGSQDLNQYISLLREQVNKDVENKLPGAVVIPMEGDDDIKKAVKQNIEWQMAADRKIGALKAFQGYMWKEGYASGELKGEVYDDVVPRLNQWRDAGKKICIYSSGSVPAQKLLVGYSDKGDLMPYFSGYFDTSVGLKVEASSYTRIAQEINQEPARILFVSDNIKEIQAAKEAGYQVVISDRPGNAPLGPESKEFKIITSFDQIA
ncbi:enolase-phosphatase e1 [Lichtheimia corymbifera JMRC:FSU:9682]|uniref:Enolase-phosphatase E1 n=1 Tax=Lichtheimia corymbifera JMRC:FSU:9682 TaxID=1263082 RepID=A0A068RNL9_9FUNG|nr:enolase-phosphatase e1 [Lichtheimia corymbifera JMRC:FSU:9682]